MVDRHLSLAVLLSIVVSFISITYTIIGVLYYDHHSKTRARDMEMNMNLVGHIDVTVRRRFGSDLANMDPLKIDRMSIYILFIFVILHESQIHLFLNYSPLDFQCLKYNLHGYS